MNALRNLFDNLKERLRSAWTEQMDSELVIRLRERFDELPTLAQKGIIAASIFLASLLLLWWPLSNITDSRDFNAKFEDHRQLLKELQQVQRDIASGPNPPMTAPPATFKSVFDQKLVANGIKPEQIKESLDVPTQIVSGTEERGFQYRIKKLTIRQIVDVTYEIEHTDPGLRILNLEIKNTDPDPHYYELTFKLVSYAPKISEIPGGGGGLIDSIKKNPGAPPGAPPSGFAPAVPTGTL
jgi:type II secretory pathway component PulM